MLLREKTAIITGCNRGIGKAILEVFAEQGADIIACTRQESEHFSNLISDLAARTGVAITPVYFDLRDMEQVKAGIKTITSLKRQVHVLVNNAGIASGSLFQMTPIEELKRVFETNFFSTLMFTQAISRFMSRFKTGSIINIASVAGLLGDSGTTSYGASKAALMLATKTMATELGNVNIRVNAVAPSVTLTAMFDQMDERSRNRLIQASALKRPAEPVEVARVALFLASDLSTFVTGQVLRVDGGLTI